MVTHSPLSHQHHGNTTFLEPSSAVFCTSFAKIFSIIPLKELQECEGRDNRPLKAKAADLPSAMLVQLLTRLTKENAQFKTSSIPWTSTLQTVCQCNYAGDAKIEQELHQLAGLPKRCLLKLHSQEREWEPLIWARLFQLESAGHNSSTRRGYLRMCREQAYFSPAQQQKLSGQCDLASLSSTNYLFTLKQL